MFVHAVKNIYTKGAVALLLGMVLSCKSVPEISHFDPVAWKEDVNGCKGIRLALAETLENERKKLKGCTETNLVRLLGTPNEVEVLARQQKYYIYWIQNPIFCKDSLIEYKSFKIRFSAVDLVTEVLF